MDRDKRWERVKLAYDALVNGKGESGSSALQIIEKSYADNITDEFIKPSVVLDSSGRPVGNNNQMATSRFVLISEQTDAGK